MIEPSSARAEKEPLTATSVVWGSTALIGAASAVLTLVVWSDLASTDSYLTLITPVAAMVYATLGVLVVRRAQNRIGWILLAEGLGQVILVLTSVYAVEGVITHPGSVPAAKVVGVLSEWIFVPIVFAFPYLFLIFPTGRLPSSRWRLFEWISVGGTALALVGFLVTPRLVALPAPGGVSLTYSNPLAIRSLSSLDSTLLLGTLPSISILTALLLLAALAALVVRYRSGGPDLRQQIKWFAYAALAFVFFQTVLSLAPVVCDCAQSPIAIAAGLASGVTVLLGIPIAITIAVL
ncbi:MAG TPA: hypothetical protein VHV50_14050, partial [Actinomycetota bacterium]|nr:hypothetical protein [Actinomycetota bacterium]